MIIDLIYQNRLHQVDVAPGTNLLEAIRQTTIPLAAPCGGHGICRKCKVNIRGIGVVNSCEFMVDESITVDIGEAPAMQILADSYFPEWIGEGEKGEGEKGKKRAGVAVDVGTTTVVVFLEDLDTGRNLGVRSFINPQQPYGADVINRILYTQEHPEGLKKLQQSLVNAIDQAVASLCRLHQADPASLSEMVVAGNTTMLHILRGTDPGSLALYPFKPVFTDEVELLNNEPGFLNIRPEKITLMPGISAFVGADIVAGLAAIDWPKPGTCDLFMDIGTNGEMALLVNDRIFTCSTAAGPAFEGARISCGMGGISGAVSVISETGFQTIDNEAPMGLCGSGLVDAIAMLLDQGVIPSSGYIEKDVVLFEANLHGRHPALVLTPQDIREVQLAKGAISAGIAVLRQEAARRLGMDTELTIDRIWLAGGFGYALHPETAARIGLIPAELKNRVIRIGNTAALGARLKLHDARYRQRVEEVMKKSLYIDLAAIDSFNELFAMGMIY